MPASDTADARAHRNLCDFVRFLARLEPGAELLDRDGVVAVCGGADFPSARTGVRADATLPAAEWAARADTFFSKSGRTASVFTRVGTDDDLTDALTARGFREWSTSPEMVCDHALEPRQPPEGVTVRFATTPADVGEYARVAGEAFAHLSIPAETTRDAIDHPDVMLGDDCVISLVEKGGDVVAGALVVILDDARCGYVGWVSCADAARGHGLGDVVTRAVTNAAFERGADLVTLEASPFGESTYARMGYRELYRYRVLIKI